MPKIAIVDKMHENGIKLLKENSLSGIIASHNPKVAEIVDRRIRISNGKVSDF